MNSRPVVALETTTECLDYGVHGSGQPTLPSFGDVSFPFMDFFPFPFPSLLLPEISRTVSLVVAHVYLQFLTHFDLPLPSPLLLPFPFPLSSTLDQIQLSVERTFPSGCGAGASVLGTTTGEYVVGTGTGATSGAVVGAIEVGGARTGAMVAGATVAGTGTGALLGARAGVGAGVVASLIVGAGTGAFVVAKTGDGVGGTTGCGAG